MKKIAYTAAVLLLLVTVGYAGTNDIWVLTDRTGTNELATVDNDGGLTLVGGVTSGGALSVTTISGTTLATSDDATLGGTTVTVTNNLVVSGTAKITGTISNTALTASQLVVTDADKVLSSSATVPAGTVDAAGLAAAVQDMLVNSFTPATVPDANGGTNVVTITAKDMGGNTLAARTLFRCWVGDTEYGAPAAVAGDVTVSTGVEVQQVLDKGHYLVLSDTNGVAVVAVMDDPGNTNFFHTVSGGGNIATVEMNFDLP